ncbi:MAG: alpha/beta fold hydrolase [Bdellovibrionales bacterium]|nr:alpha/beta fold hydrolase [Bdellovibrionales bacterium]
MDWLSFFLYALGFVVLLVLTQDLHIFPGAVLSKINFFGQRNKIIPPEVESIFIRSLDGTSLEVWRYAPESETSVNNYVAVIFHGNGGPVENFLFVQMWLAELGIPSYSFDYRGFGRSSGWPSEKGIYKDSDAVWKYVVEREGVTPDQIVVVGISVGSAPAARAAALHHPKLLLLSSAFIDLRSAARAQPVVGLLAPFVWHRFPTKEYVQTLKQTHLLLAHGLKDNIVPPKHSELLEEAYIGDGNVRRLEAKDSGHNLAFYALKDELKESLREWLSLLPDREE